VGISALSLAELSGPIFSVQLIMEGGPHWMIVIYPTRISRNPAHPASEPVSMTDRQREETRPVLHVLRQHLR
jgi:hypothetical protein